MEFIASALPWLLCVAGFSFLSWELCRAREMSRAEISRATMKARVAIVRDEYERLAKEAAVMREKLARYEAQRQTRHRDRRIWSAAMTRAVTENDLQVRHFERDLYASIERSAKQCTGNCNQGRECTCRPLEMACESGEDPLADMTLLQRVRQWVFVAVGI